MINETLLSFAGAGGAGLIARLFGGITDLLKMNFANAVEWEKVRQKNIAAAHKTKDTFTKSTRRWIVLSLVALYLFLHIAGGFMSTTVYVPHTAGIWGWLWGKADYVAQTFNHTFVITQSVQDIVAACFGFYIGLTAKRP